VLAIVLRVIILVTGDADANLAARIEGQTADLDAEIERVASPRLPAELPGQLAVARRLADERDADAIVWFRRDDDGWIVHVAEAEGERVLVRRVQTRGGAMSSSAAIEGAAVVVRTALRGLASGGEIGVSEPEVVAVAPSEPVDVTIDRPAEPIDRPAAEEPVTRPLRPFAELAWSGVLDGERAAGTHGVAARLGVAGGPFRIAAVATHHPGATYRSRDATIEVERQTLGLALGIDVAGAASLRRHARWRVGADVALAMARFPRTTTTTSPGLEPTAGAVIWTPIATPAVRLSRRIAPGTWVAVTLGADLVARPPQFGVASGEGFVPVATLWSVQPHAGIGIVVDPF